MKRMFLFIVIYVLASFAMQAQVVNPDGLKEMWVNDKIDGKIYISPDSTSYFHFYYSFNPKIMKVYKRDLLTNDIICEKDVDDLGYDGQTPEMALSPDGNFILMKLYRTPFSDTLFVYNQQNLEFIKTIVLDINDITEGMYDAEEIEAQMVEFLQIKDPMFITNDKFTFRGIFSGKDFVPEEYRIKGYFSCIYNIETGKFINEFKCTKPSISIFIDEFIPFPDGKSVLVKTPGSVIKIPIDIFLDIIENNAPLTEYETIYGYIPSNVGYNVEGDLVYNINNEKLRVYDLNSKTLLANEYIKTYPALSVFINKQFITINNRENANAIALYDFINKEFYNIINNTSAYDIHYYIKELNYLIFNIGPNFTAYQINIDTIVGVRDDSEVIEIIYPNPASDYIEISLDGAYLEGGHHLEIEIYDVLGNLVINYSTFNTLTPALSLREREHRIDVSQLPKGVYFVKIGDRVEKFIKM